MKRCKKDVTLGEIKDIEYLFYYENLSAYETAKILEIKKGRVDNISHKYLKNQRKRKKIDTEEKNKIVKMFEEKHLHYITIAQKMKRSKYTVRNIIREETGNCNNNRFIFKNSRKIWTKEEFDYVRKNYKEHTAKEIARTLGRSEVAVFTKIRDLRKNEKIDYKPRGGHPNFRIVLKL